MTYRMELWGRFSDPQFWWMSAMLGLWLVFMLMVFVLEPLLRARFERSAGGMGGAVMRIITRIHAVLLTLAALTVLAAVAGSHGLLFF